MFDERVAKPEVVNVEAIFNGRFTEMVPLLEIEILVKERAPPVRLVVADSILMTSALTLPPCI